MKKTLVTTLIASGIALATLSGAAHAKGRLVVYCSATNEMCEAETKAFGEKYDVKTSFIRNGSGSTLAKVDAEKKNPQADVWYGGTLDPQSQAGEMGLLQPYKSPNLTQVMEQFRDPAKLKGNYSSAVYVGILGFGVNTQRLKEKNLPVPKCWKDLTKPEYKGEIQIADPQSSGTAYTALATFAQLWGDDQAFDYLKQLNANVSQYTKSGIAPARNAARGETYHRHRLPARLFAGKRTGRAAGADLAVRRHRLRNWRREHSEGRAQPRQRQTVRRLGAVERGPGAGVEERQVLSDPDQHQRRNFAELAEARRPEAYQLRHG